MPWIAAEAGAETRRHAPATLRNRDAIVAVLTDIVPNAGLVLEIASGSGEHIVYFARRFAHLDWQPSDPDPAALASITAWSADAALPNLRSPLLLDASARGWPVVRADALLCINMVHISPWAATLGLMDGAARILAPGAPMILYGPFVQAGVPTAPGNVAFDASLRDRNAAWGLRDVADVVRAADAVGFAHGGTLTMPANNLILLFSRR